MAAPLDRWRGDAWLPLGAVEMHLAGGMAYPVAGEFSVAARAAA